MSAPVKASASGAAGVQVKPTAEGKTVPVKAETPSPDAEASTDARYLPFNHQLKLNGGLNPWMSNGPRDAGFFDSSFGEPGDFFGGHLEAGFLTNLNGGKAQVLIGGNLGYQRITGDPKTFGSTYQFFGIGPQIELNIDRLWDPITSGKASFLSRLGIATMLGYHAYDGTNADGLLHDKDGIGFQLRPYLNVVNFRLGNPSDKASAIPSNIGVNLNWMFAHGPGKLANGTPANTTLSSFPIPGFAVEARWDIAGRKVEPKVIKVETPAKVVKEPTCDNWKKLIADRLAEINGKDGQPGLKAQIKVAEGEVTKLRTHIETRKTDPLKVKDVRDVLREQMVDRLVQEAAPKDEAAKKAAIAKATVAAKASYPDNYNHWETVAASPDASKLVVPNPLPKDCDKLQKIYENLTSGKEGLDKRLGDLDRLRRTPFRPRIEKIINKTIEKVNPNLKDVHFNNGRPQRWELKPTISAMNKAKDPSTGLVDFNNRTVRARFNQIFGSRYVDKMLATLRDTAKVLNRDIMKKFNDIEIQGHTSTTGSAANNMTLSDRRAELVKEILIGMGVKASRLKARGYGQTQLKNTDEPKLKRGSPEKADAEAENRRIEIHISDGEIKRVIGEVAAGEPDQSPPPPPPAPAKPTYPAPKPRSKPKPKPKKPGNDLE